MKDKDKSREQLISELAKLRIRYAELEECETTTDITGRKLAEEELIESEERYRSIFNDVAVSLWEYDFSESMSMVNQLKASGITDFRTYFKENSEEAERIISPIKLTDVNNSTLKLYGAETKEQLLTEFGKHHTPEAFKTFLEAGIAFIEGKNYYECETVNQTLDGRLRYIILRIIFAKPHKGRYKALASATDITERKIAENALKFGHEQLLSIFDSIDEVIYVTDPFTYEILYVNMFLKTLLGGNPVGSLCYKEFQGLDKPCDFCNNDTLLEKKNEPFKREFFNPLLDKYFLIFDRIITWPDGRDVRFEKIIPR